MFCPLCRSEYRPGITQCADCHLPLVLSLDSDAVRAHPPRLLWIGRYAAEFDRLVGALREADIPAHAQEAVTGIVGSLLKAESTIHVLQSDFKRALAIAAEAAVTGKKSRDSIQTCYSCGSECSAALTTCPKCESVLIVEPRKETPDSLESPLAGAMKYCPVCDAEYLATYDHCTLCGVELVPEDLRGHPLHEKERNEPLDMIWKSGDPVAVSQAIAALREAGIPHHVKTTNDHFVFELGIPRPKYEVRVFRSDADRARALLEPIRESLPFALEEHVEAEEAGKIEERHATEWKPAQATAEIWSGEDAGLAHILEDCLRENRIGFRREGAEPGTLRLFVMPADADTAREILREIAEGTPPL